ncbi:MAG: PAS domain S-box protein [Spartobacteria bacterium]|nr:PAS domain S-box protein [Spartobacteria bacterium]
MTKPEQQKAGAGYPVWQSLLDAMPDFFAANSNPEEISDLLDAGLRWFLRMPGCESASLFLFDQESLDFHHSLSFPPENRADAINRAARFEENGMLGDALNADSVIFPFTEEDGSHGKLVRISLPAEVLGYVMLRSSIPIDAVDQISLRLCALHASHFAYMLKHARLIRRFERQQELLEQKVAARTRRIEQSKREIITLLNSLKTGVLVIDPVTNVVEEANEFAARLIGNPEDGLLGKPWRTFFSQGSRTEHGLPTSAYSLVNAEYILQNADGWRIPVLLTLTSVRISGRDRFLCSFVDITDRKQAEEALRRSKEKTELLNRQLEEENHRSNQMALQAEAASVAKSAFLANIGHELRTPMNAILGFTSLIMQADLPPEQREYMTIIQERGEDLLKLIENILEYSRMEAAKLELTSAPFSLREIMGETMQGLEFSAREKELKFTWRIDPDVPDNLKGDHLRLQQILQNIVGNAIKFTHDGFVDTTIRGFDESIALPEEKENDDLDFPVWIPPPQCRETTLHVIVRDSGIGIPPEKQEHIFQPFAQADDSSTRKFGGVGLGLATAWRLTRLLGGAIWLQSEPDKGSIFQFIVKFGVPARPDIM